jgi:hypothetical protein
MEKGRSGRGRGPLEIVRGQASSTDFSLLDLLHPLPASLEQDEAVDIINQVAVIIGALSNGTLVHDITDLSRLSHSPPPLVGAYARTSGQPDHFIQTHLVFQNCSPRPARRSSHPKHSGIDSRRSMGTYLGSGSGEKGSGNGVGRVGTSTG